MLLALHPAISNRVHSRSVSSQDYRQTIFDLTWSKPPFSGFASCFVFELQESTLGEGRKGACGGWARGVGQTVGGKAAPPALPTPVRFPGLPSTFLSTFGQSMRYRLLVAAFIPNRQIWTCKARSYTQSRRRSISVKQPEVDSIKQEKVEGGEAPGSHEKDHVTESGSLDLPLSPLMDPKLEAARTRYKTRKPEANSKPSEFQTKLRKNPYGIPFLAQKYTVSMLNT